MHSELGSDSERSKKGRSKFSRRNQRRKKGLGLIDKSDIEEVSKGRLEGLGRALMACRGERLGLRHCWLLVWCLGLRSMAFEHRLVILGLGIPPLLKRS